MTAAPPILTAEGVKQSAILTAEGEKQSQILRAEGSAQARILEAQGQARAIQQVFEAIHRGKPTQKLLAYQYLQVLPQLARGDSNKMWIIPTELTDALKGIGNALGGSEPRPERGDDDDAWVDTGDADDDAFAETVARGPGQGAGRGPGAGRPGQRRVDRARRTAGPASSRRSAARPTGAAPPRRPAAAAAPPAAAAERRAAGRAEPARAARRSRPARR